MPRLSEGGEIAMCAGGSVGNTLQHTADDQAKLLRVQCSTRHRAVLQTCWEF